MSAVDPVLKPSLIDRFIISAAKGGTEAIVCINKADLIDPVELQPILGLVRPARLPDRSEQVLKPVGGIRLLRNLLKGKQSVFTGQSGVGKSSLLNSIQPGLAQPTKDVSTWTHKGKTYDQASDSGLA